MKLKLVNPWIVCLAASSFFFYQFLQIALFNVLKPNLMVAFNTSSSSLSIVSSLYFYGTILFLIPAGILLDNLSTRTIILSAMLISLLGLGIFTCANDVYVAGLGRFIIGISGGPFGLQSIIRLASRWFPENRMAFITGVIVAIGMVGGVISQAPFTLLIDAYGWKNAMLANLGLGLLLSLVLFMFVHDYPPGKKQEFLQQQAYYRRNGFVKGLSKVILKTQNWYCGLFASLLNLPIFILGALWGIMYLTQEQELSSVAASAVCSMLFIGMIIGSPVFGFISDKLRLRKFPMLVGIVICLAAMLMLNQNAVLSTSALMCIFLLIGFGSSSQILAYPTVTEINPSALTGSSLGLASTLIMSGGAVFQPIVGWLDDFNQDYVIYCMAVCLFLSGVVAYFINETYCRRSL